MAVERVVSLVPSLTEAVADLGCGARLIGITDYCPPVSPAAARVGGPRAPDVDAIARLRPDLVIACLEENPPEALARIARACRVHVFSCRSLDEGVRLVLALGRLLGREEESGAVARRIQAAREGVRRLVARTGEEGVVLPRRLFYPVWKDPWIAVGTDCFAAEMLREAGGVSVFADRGEAYPRVDPTQVCKRAPDLILLPDEPWRFSHDEARDLTRAWAGEAPAVRFVPGRWAAWYGTRMDEGLRGLAAAILKQPWPRS